eukprot:3829309-Amphidinium_carterae.1
MKSAAALLVALAAVLAPALALHLRGVSNSDAERLHVASVMPCSFEVSSQSTKPKLAETITAMTSLRHLQLLRLTRCVMRAAITVLYLSKVSTRVLACQADAKPP